MDLKPTAIALFAGVAIALPPITAKADVPGVTLAPGNDTSTELTQTANQVNITGGQQAGSNLFHSFGQFNVGENQIANFVIPANIENILGRVTNGAASTIDGILKVSGIDGNPYAANLYLMNPAGILFGPNSQINISGIFTATTANGIGFGANWFNASGSNNYDNLTGNPTSYAFSMAQPAVIINNATNLGGTSNPNISLIGGTVVSTTPLTTSGGVTIAAVPGSSLVKISQPNSLLSLEIDSLQVASSRLNAVPFNPSSLPNLLTGGELKSATGLSVNAQGQVQLIGSGLSVSNGGVVINGGINTSNTNSGNGGDIVIQAIGNILINGNTYTYANFAGRINLNAIGDIRTGNINVAENHTPDVFFANPFSGNDIVVKGESISMGNINAGARKQVAGGSNIGLVALTSTQGDIITGFIASGISGININAQRYFRATEIAYNQTLSGPSTLNPTSVSFPEPLVTFREFVRNRVQNNSELINYFSSLDLNEDGLPDFTREQLQNPDTLPSIANFSVQLLGSKTTSADISIPVSVVAQSRGSSGSGDFSPTSINITHGGQTPERFSNIDSSNSDTDKVLIQGRGQNFGFEVGPRSVSFERVIAFNSVPFSDPNFVLLLNPIYEQATLASNVSGTVGAIGVTREVNGYIFIGLRDIPISQITRTPAVAPTTTEIPTSEVILTRNTANNLECTATSGTEEIASAGPCGAGTGNILQIEDNQTPTPTQNQQSQLPQELTLGWASKPILSLASINSEQ